jgi:hypothetical protein
MAAPSNTTFRITELDFFTIRENLKNYLRGQDTFTDYDYEGSGMSVLLDLLAYNTHYNAYYMNMIANEAFLDTAQIRENVLSHAKIINYVPTSVRGAQAMINVRVTPTEGSEDTTATQLRMKRFTRLLGTDINGVNHPFVTMYSNTVSKTGESFYFPNVMIRQGEAMTYQFRMMSNNITRSFEIPSANVDTSTLIVTVQESISNTFTSEYKLASDLTEIKSDSKIFYIEENDNLNYSIYFGDNVLGMRPKNGSIVVATYVDSIGSGANNVNQFAFIDRVQNKYSNNVRITTVQSSRSGQDKESIDQIRFRAPHFYSAQNRAVTVNDYETLILKDFDNIDAISVWGGEDNDPPIYGKVFISIKTKGYYSLSNIEKENIKNSLINNRNVLTVTPEIIDPEYIFVQVRGKITYDPALTSKTPAELIDDAKVSIGQYADEKLNTFSATFKKSQLQTYIEGSNPAINGSDVNIYLQKRLPVFLNQSRNYIIRFNTPLRKGDYINKLFTYPQIGIFDSRDILRNVYIEEVPNSFTGVDSVRVLASGINYDSSTKISIIGDGTGAKAIPEVINGKLNRIIVTSKGTNYTTAIITITSDFGSGASAAPVLESKIGNLRAYFFKETTGEKVIINENIGSINYETGVIQLSSVNVRSVESNDFYDSNVLAVSVIPQEQVILPGKNRILSLDVNDPLSIQLEMIEQA